MSKKRIIACWLLVVYLVTAIGPAWASLSCRCLRMQEQPATACCAHHHHQHDAACDQPAGCSDCDAHEHDASWSAPCCDDRHSTEIALYTCDDDRTDRLQASAALPLSTDPCTLTAPEPTCSDRPGDRPGGRLCHGSVRCAGAHAPPVCA